MFSEPNDLHWGAVRWYYDLLMERGRNVPEAILRHVRRCLVCRRQIDRLNKAVNGAGGETDVNRSTMKRDVIETLSLHFGCLEKQVTCARVKPFLPSLLMPDQPLRIPTPITVHIDHCPQCADDLRALRDLDLTARQLERLERLYGHSGAPCSTARAPQARGAASSLRMHRFGRLRLRTALQCRRARSRIPAFVDGRLEEIDAGILDHLCTCPRCRPHVHRCREERIESEPPSSQGQRENPVCEGGIPMARLFDYAVPYGRTGPAGIPSPAAPGSESTEHCREQGGCGNGNRVERKVSQDHLQTCRACLRRIQELDETIYGIAGRQDSGITTIYRTTSGAAAVSSDAASDGPDTNVAESFADSYPQYPIEVEVLRHPPQPAAAKPAQPRPAFDPRVRFLLKTAVAAAAMIPLAFVFRGTSTASGITLAQVFHVFEKAPNVHVTMFRPDRDQPAQELWISRETQCLLVAERKVRTLFDLDKSKKTSYSSTEEVVGVTDLDEIEYANARRYMDACLGFTFANVPFRAGWTQIEHDNTHNVATYELNYSDRSVVGKTTLQRWRIMIDLSTALPREVREFAKSPTQKEWHYISKIVLEYVTADEMRAIIAPH